MDNDFLADIISEVFDGVTVWKSSFGPIYIKHFHQLETVKLFNRKEGYIEEANQRGVPTEREMLDTLYEDKMWTPEQEDSLNEQLEFIKNLKNSLVKIKIPSHREKHKREIRLKEKEVDDLLRERVELIGLTAERYAEKRVQRDFCEAIFFSDVEFTKPTFKELDFSDPSIETELLIIQKTFLDKFSDDNLSKAVLSPYFSYYLPYCDDVMGMFGKSIKELTAYELKLMSFARTFLNIFRNTTKEIPKEIMHDPEAILEFHEAQKNGGSKKGKGADGSGGTTYFGANQSDMEVMKEDGEEVVKLSDAIKEKGGSLNMKDLMKLHGA